MDFASVFYFYDLPMLTPDHLAKLQRILSKTHTNMIIFIIPHFLYAVKPQIGFFTEIPFVFSMTDSDLISVGKRRFRPCSCLGENCSSNLRYFFYSFCTHAETTSSSAMTHWKKRYAVASPVAAYSAIGTQTTPCFSCTSQTAASC